MTAALTPEDIDAIRARWEAAPTADQIVSIAARITDACRGVDPTGGVDNAEALADLAAVRQDARRLLEEVERLGKVVAAQRALDEATLGARREP